MAAQHIEGTLRALQSKLRDTLPNAIAVVNGDAPDDHALDVVASPDITIGVRADIVSFPAIMLLPAESGPMVDQGQRVLWTHRIRVVGWLAEYQEEALALKLLRFQRAIRECLLKDRIPSVTQDSSAGYLIQHLRDEFGPVFRPEEGGANFVQGASSLFSVSQQQDIA